MFKRKLSSSSSEKNLPKKSNGKACKLTAEDAPPSKGKTSKNTAKRSHDSRSKKTNSTKRQSNNILNYLTSCSSSRSNSNGEVNSSSVKSKNDGEKINFEAKQQKFDRYCPKCQMPVVSLSCPLFQEHVMICIERDFDFQGPCPKDLTCDEQSPDHFKTYSHDLLAESRSTQQNKEVQKVCHSTEKMDVHCDDHKPFVPSPKDKKKKSHSLSPLKRLANEMENIDKPEESFSKSLHVPEDGDIADGKCAEKLDLGNDIKDIQCIQKDHKNLSKNDNDEDGVDDDDDDDCTDDDDDDDKYDVHDCDGLSLSPLKRLANEMANIHRPKESFSKSLFTNEYDGIVCDGGGGNDVHDYGDDDGASGGNDEDCIDDDDKTNGNKDDDCNYNGTGDDDKDKSHNVESNSKSFDHLCEHDYTDSDELLANLVIDSSDIASKLPKYSLTSNQCEQNFNVTKSTDIKATVQKEDLSSNKYKSGINPIKKYMIKTNQKSSGSTSTKQSDIGTFFGIPALTKTIEQSKVNHKNSEEVTNPSNTEVAIDDSSSGGYRGNRKCPFYKKIPGTPFVVDAFNYGVIPGTKAYFLSHFHYDHYQGLKSRFSGTIYCSKITANLVRSRIKVDPRFIKELPLNVASPVDKVQVTLLEANHCPGAVLFLFELPTGETYLHTGDFRASPSMEEYTIIRKKHIDTLFLDTTYCDPSYSFPSQDETVQFAVRKALQAKQNNPKTLIVCGTYTIGKEKVFLAIAEALQCKISVTREKKRTLDCFDSDGVSSKITLDWNAGCVHVMKMADLKFQTLRTHLDKYKQSFNEILAFKPTGWEYKSRSLNDIVPSKAGPITIYGVPYSEHSSYKELERFVKFFKPDKVIPTVNVRSTEQRTIINSWISNKSG